MKMRYAAVLLATVALGACDKSGLDPILAPNPPMAFTRFINAVPDTGATDWRFIDQVEYSPIGLGMAFRSFSPYQQTSPGARQLRIFPTTTNIAITQQHFIDQSITLEANKYYTIIHHGFSRTGSTPADAITVLEDAIPATVAATNIATRAVHLGAGLGNIDVYALASTTTAISGTPLFSNIAYLGGGATYNSTLAVGPMAFRATNAATTTVQASTLAPAGAPADLVANLTRVGGTGQGGSVITGFYFPRSVAGSQAASFTTPGIVFLVDRHPQ